MSKMRLLILFAFVSWSLSIVGVSSVRAAGRCNIYDRISAAVPPSVQPVFKSGEMLRISGSGRTSEYFVRHRAWKGSFDVCHFVEQQLFPVSSYTGDVVLSETPPATDAAISRYSFMMITSAICPLQDDDRYVPTRGVSEGVFVALARLVQRVGASHLSQLVCPSTNLGALSSNVSLADQVPHYKKMKIRAINLIDYETYESPAKYQIAIGEAERDRPNIVILADLSEGSFCISSMGSIPILGMPSELEIAATSKIAVGSGDN